MAKKKSPPTKVSSNQEIDITKVIANVKQNPAESSVQKQVKAQQDPEIVAQSKRVAKQLDLTTRAIRYLSLCLFIIFVYSGLLLTDYIILYLVTWLLRDEISRHQIVSMFFNYLKIGLALAIMLGAAIHGFFTLRTLIKLDQDMSDVLERNEDD